MARDFDGVDDGTIALEYTETEAMFQTGPSTMFVWFNVDSDGQGSAAVPIAIGRDANIDTVDVRTVLESGSNIALRVFADWTTTDGTWDTAVDIPLGEWHSMGVDYDGSDVNENPNLWVDGVSDDLTETVGPPEGTLITNDQHWLIGCRKTNTGNRRTIDGQAAFGALWSDALSANEQAVLGRGVHPFILRNDILIGCIPLYGNNSPEPNLFGGGNDSTVVEATKGTNPPVELLENFI